MSIVLNIIITTGPGGLYFNFYNISDSLLTPTLFSLAFLIDWGKLLLFHFE